MQDRKVVHLTPSNVTSKHTKADYTLTGFRYRYRLLATGNRSVCSRLNLPLHNFSPPSNSSTPL